MKISTHVEAVVNFLQSPSHRRATSGSRRHIVNNSWTAESGPRLLAHVPLPKALCRSWAGSLFPELTLLERRLRLQTVAQHPSSRHSGKLPRNGRITVESSQGDLFAECAPALLSPTLTRLSRNSRIKVSPTHELEQRRYATTAPYRRWTTPASTASICLIRAG